MRGMDSAPFDALTLFSKASQKFISFVVLACMVLLSAVFSGLASAAGCMAVNSSNFFAKGFLVLSAQGHGIE